MLLDQIQSDLKEAQKSKDEMRVSTLRFLLSEVYNKRIDLHMVDGQVLPDEEVIAIIRHQAKQHNEAVEAFDKAGRAELSQKEKSELEILNHYLPQQLPAEDVEKVVLETVKELFSDTTPSMANFGQIMGAVMGKLKGKAEGNTVSAAVKKVIAG